MLSIEVEDWRVLGLEDAILNRDLDLVRRLVLRVA
jgi:hypothetical protein